MALPLWPSTLPLGIRYGAELEFGREGSKAVSEFENGPKLRRERFTNVPMMLSCEVKYNDQQIERLKAFYIDTLRNGTRKFIAPVLTGAEIEYRRCEFDMPSLKPVAADYNYWLVPMSFEVRGVIPISGGTYWYLDYFGYEFGTEFADRIDYIVNTQYPMIMEDY